MYDIYSYQKIANRRVLEGAEKGRKAVELREAGLLNDSTIRERAARALLVVARRLDPDIRLTALADCPPQVRVA